MQKLTYVLATGLLAVASAAYAAEPASSGTQPAAPQASTPPAASAPAPKKSTSSSMKPATAQTKTAPAAVKAMAAAAPSHARRHAALSRTEIEQVQAALNKSGAKIAADGVWGMKTEAALKEFQRQHQLKVSGHLDHNTRKQLDLAG